ncbi:hypothetical protein C2G38_2138039 [Gigaspora rosea]|uniref:PNPLA domain-containing protein n=1 Tax=Gigaspora rosea TaxID=44941 RepID=A0A397W3X5_9GLOM|nr:hypothetical protein C2G38_2138039 [Gigaspora rosea]
MCSQIDACFSNIEALIRSQLEDNTQNHFEVDQKFTEATKLISEIEDDNQHRLYNYKYHTTYCSYLRAIGDTKNANKQERLARRFETYTNTRTEGTQIALNANVASNNINQDDTRTEGTQSVFANGVASNDINLKEILEELNKIRPILKDEVVKVNVVDKLISEIQRIFEKLSEITKTFEEAPLYALAAMLLQIRDPTITQQELNETKKIFDKVNGGSKEKEKNDEGMSTDLNTDIKLEKDFNDAMAYSNITEQELNETKKIFDKVNGGSKEKEKKEEGMSTDLNTDIKLEKDFDKAMAYSNIMQQELNETKKIFDKVNGGSKEKENNEEGMSTYLNTVIKLEKDFNNAMTSLCSNNQGISLFDRENIRNSIKNLINPTNNSFIKAERSLVRYQISDKQIVRTKRHANSYRIKAGAFMAVGGIVGGAALVDNFGLILLPVIILTGPVELATGAACLLAGLGFGYYLINKGKELFKEPKIREKLNEIINKALCAYYVDKYQEFINALSEKYDENRKPLLDCHNNIGIIGIDEMVNTLQTHGFRSDGIAYLLVVLGEVLGSGKIKINGITRTVLKVNAKQSFQLALSDKLVKEARKLDKCTSDLRKTCHGNYERYFKSTYGKLKDYIFSKEHTRLALEYLDDSQEMPFFSRLEEMRNIARINIAILNIIEYDEEAYEMAKKTIEDVRQSVEENYQFVSKVEIRLEVLEDFLWIIGKNDLFDNTSSTTKSTSELDNKYINNLKNEYYKAVYFERLAENEAKTNKLNSLRHWQSAQKNYNIAHEIDPDNPIYSLGYARCLLKLSKYTQVIELSDTYSGLNSISEYWYLRSVAYFKQKKYKDAMTCNTEALNLVPGNIPAGKCRELIIKFNVDNTIEHHIDRYKKELTYEIDYLKNSHSDESPSYKILSIDGGGIRGVLPTLWLSEIEYRTHRPISHLFNMIAGTSTGGIIAAGLSAPQFKPINETTDEYEYSNLVPIFSASELLNIYKNESNKLFSKSTTWFNIFSNVRDESRSTMFKKYFGKTRLSHSLTELVIPAANENDSHLFTRYDACKNSKNNEVNNTFVDILMATTAAPTFFPPHKIGNKTFIDGGVYLNNPASTAYDKAISYNVPKEKISVLSLGTGYYLPDPSNPDQYSNLLFWTQNKSKLMISTQEYKPDHKMYKELKNRYQRWQVFFEKPIRFDDYESIACRNLKGTLFPCVGLRSQGGSIEVNFGSRKFKFEGATFGDELLKTKWIKALHICINTTKGVSNYIFLILLMRHKLNE